MYVLEKIRKDSNYYISFDTFSLKPVIKDYKIHTEIIERNADFSVAKTPGQIVKKSCEYYGGSLQQATNYSRLVIKKKQKLPIIVAHDFGMPFVFLPTMSPSSALTVWIALHAIDNIESTKLGSRVFLENGQFIDINVAATTMYRQCTYGLIMQKDFLKKQRHLNRSSLF